MGSIGIQQEQVYDVLIIGAGLSGICSLHHVQQRFPSWRIQVLEAGSDVGEHMVLQQIPWRPL